MNNNTAKWSLIIAIVGPILTITIMLGTFIFGYGQLKEDVKQLHGRFDRLEDRMDKRFDKIDEHFDRVDRRFDKVDNELTIIRQNHLEHITALHANRVSQELKP